MGIYVAPGHATVSQEFILNGAPHPFVVVTGHAVAEGDSTLDVADDIKGCWAGAFWVAANRSNDTALGRTRVLRRRLSGVLESAENPTIVPGTGPLSASPPPNSCILVRKRTALAGRQFRGRMYLPPIWLGESFVNNAGIIDPATRAVLQGWADNWEVLVDALHPHRLLHEDPAVPPTVVSSLSVESLLATQRRRMRG